MAEDGSPIKGSDAFFDYKCTNCLSKKKSKKANTEAVFYCPECNKYLCRQCISCSHDVIGRGNVDKWKKPSEGLQFDPCPRHEGHVIQLYCKKHDVVCCPECGKTDHKICGKLHYIPSVASAKGNARSLKSVKKDLDELYSKADQLGDKRTFSLTDLDNKEMELVDSVTNFKCDLVYWLDDIEVKSLEEIRKHKATLTEKFKSELAVCDAVKTEVTNLHRKLDACSKNEARMFCRLKQGIEKIEDKTHLIADVASSECSYLVQFMLNKKLERQVISCSYLGEFFTDPFIGKTKTPELDKVTKSQGQNSHSDPPNKPYTVIKKASVKVRVSNDKETCNIYGMCQMADGSIIVADFQNESLKRLDSNYKVTSHCCLSNPPWDVCVIKADEVAVAMSDGVVQFVSVGDTMTKKDSFPSYITRGSITYSHDCLFVAEYRDDAIHGYDLHGNHIRTIYTDRHGNQLFTSINRIAASADGDRIYITEDTGIITVDTAGVLLAMFNPPDLEEEGGGFAVCVDGSDNVFVGGCGSDNILQVENGEKQMAEILCPSDKIRPYALCFDAVNLRLLVSVSYSDIVHVLHLSKLSILDEIKKSTVTFYN